MSPNHNARKPSALARPDIDLVSPRGTTTKNAIEVAQNNCNSWNRHDADADSRIGNEV
jgi:hypothetical protein